MSPAYCLAFVALLAQFGAWPWAASSESQSGVQFTQDTLAEVKQNVAEGRAVLADVRSQREWNQGHIHGSVFLPVDSLRGPVDPAELAKKLPKEKIVYTFCVVGKRAQTAAIPLQQHGYTVRVLKPGYAELLRAGFQKAEAGRRSNP